MTSFETKYKKLLLNTLLRERSVEMKENKKKNKTTVGLLPCSGACNVGNMSVKVAGRIVKEGEDVQYVCALGLPLKIESIVSKARMADKYIALNGCDVSCATRALHAINIKPDREYCIIKDFTIKKTGDFQDETKLEEIIVAVQQSVKDLRKSFSRKTI